MSPQVHGCNGLAYPAGESMLAWECIRPPCGRVDVGTGQTSGACSTAHRSNKPDHWDGLMLDKSAVGQLSSLSSRTK